MLTRPKTTTFQFFPLALFDDLHQMCNGSHPHEAWGHDLFGEVRDDT